MVIRSANLCSVPRLAAECTTKSGASPKKMTDEADFSTDADHFDGPLRAMSTFYTNVPDGPYIYLSHIRYDKGRYHSQK